MVIDTSGMWGEWQLLVVGWGSWATFPTYVLRIFQENNTSLFRLSVHQSIIHAINNFRKYRLPQMGGERVAECESIG